MATQDSTTSKACAECGVVKAFDHFGLNNNCPDRMQLYCNSCLKAIKAFTNQNRGQNYEAPYPDITGVAFKACVGFPSYCVGDDGSVWSCKASHGRVWRRLSPGKDRTGHFYVCLYRDKERFWPYVHDLVLEAFVGPRPDEMQACHFPDKDPSNNTRGNLRWDTSSGNAWDREFHKALLGPDAKHERLNIGAVRQIRGLKEQGLPLSEISRLTGVRLTQVYNVTSGRTWSHVV